MRGWHAAEQRREKVQPCQTQGGNLCVVGSGKQGKGKMEDNEEWVMLARGPGFCPAYGAPLSLLFAVMFIAKFPPRINS